MHLGQIQGSECIYCISSCHPRVFLHFFSAFLLCCLCSLDLLHVGQGCSKCRVTCPWSRQSGKLAQQSREMFMQMLCSARSETWSEAVSLVFIPSKYSTADICWLLQVSVCCGGQPELHWWVYTCSSSVLVGQGSVPQWRDPNLRAYSVATAPPLHPALLHSKHQTKSHSW